MNSDPKGQQYAVVFSGGGALAAWEVGCLRALTAHHGGFPVAVTGASAGAINAAAVRAGVSVDEMQKLWADLRPEDVYQARPSEMPRWRLVIIWLWGLLCTRSLMKATKLALTKVKSLYDARPLKDTLEKHFKKRWDDFEKSTISVALAVTDLEKQSKRYYYSEDVGGTRSGVWVEIESLDMLVKVLMASAAIPVVFAPFGNLVDGGVARNQPLLAAVGLVERETIIYVLIPHVKNLVSTENVLENASHVMDTWLSAGLQAEMREVGVKNIIGKIQNRLIPVCEIRPGIDLASLGSGLLEFGSAVQVLCDRGKIDTEAELRKFNPNNEKTWPLETRP